MDVRVRIPPEAPYKSLSSSWSGRQTFNLETRVQTSLGAPTNPSIAQPEERDATNVKVTGSSPVRGSIRKAGDDWLKSSFHSSSCSLDTMTGDAGHPFQFPSGHLGDGTRLLTET